MGGNVGAFVHAILLRWARGAWSSRRRLSGRAAHRGGLYRLFGLFHLASVQQAARGSRAILSRVVEAKTQRQSFVDGLITVMWSRSDVLPGHTAAPSGPARQFCSSHFFWRSSTRWCAWWYLLLGVCVDKVVAILWRPRARKGWNCSAARLCSCSVREWWQRGDKNGLFLVKVALPLPLRNSCKQRSHVV
jgi:hypothetical protein